MVLLRDSYQILFPADSLLFAFLSLWEIKSSSIQKGRGTPRVCFSCAPKCWLTPRETMHYMLHRIEDIKNSTCGLIWLSWVKPIMHPLQIKSLISPASILIVHEWWVLKCTRYRAHLKTEAISHSLGYLIQCYDTANISETSFAVMNGWGWIVK